MAAPCVILGAQPDDELALLRAATGRGPDSQWTLVDGTGRTCIRRAGAYSMRNTDNSTNNRAAKWAARVAQQFWFFRGFGAVQMWTFFPSAEMTARHRDGRALVAEFTRACHAWSQAVSRDGGGTCILISIEPCAEMFRGGRINMPHAHCMVIVPSSCAAAAQLAAFRAGQPCVTANKKRANFAAAMDLVLDRQTSSVRAEGEIAEPAYVRQPTDYKGILCVVGACARPSSRAFCCTATDRTPHAPHARRLPDEAAGQLALVWEVALL